MKNLNYKDHKGETRSQLFEIYIEERFKTIEDEHDTEIRELKRLIKRLDLGIESLREVKAGKVEVDERNKDIDKKFDNFEKELRKKIDDLEKLNSPPTLEEKKSPRIDPSYPEQKPSSPSIPSAWKETATYTAKPDLKPKKSLWDWLKQKTAR